MRRQESPSSRRAWIEIILAVVKIKLNRVALLAEGVDRNQSFHILSLADGVVALLAEGVDRNLHVWFLWQSRQ